MSEGIYQISKHFSDWKIKLNNSKTEAILFTHSRIMQKLKKDHQILLNGSKLIWHDQVKYLGVLLDSKLTFSKNIQTNVVKAKKVISTLYCLLKKHSHVNFHSKLTIYKSYIRPILTYACPVFSNCAKTHISKLQTIQNKCLRMVLNAPYRTKISILHKLCNLPTISEFIDKLSENFYHQTSKSTNNLIKELGSYSYDSLPFRVKHKLPKKKQ